MTAPSAAPDPAGSQSWTWPIDPAFSCLPSEQTDPDAFYRILAADSVAQVAAQGHWPAKVVLDIGGGVGYSTDAFRQAGAACVLVEPDLANLDPLRARPDPRISGRPHQVAVAPDARFPETPSRETDTGFRSATPAQMSRSS